MKSLVRFGSQLVVLSLLAGLPGQHARAQAAPVSAESQASPITLRSVKVVNDQRGPAVEIIANRPITPTLQKLEGPSRLVIDLPNTRLAWGRKRIDFRNEQISGLRIDQYQANPPVARIVVDLAKPVEYTWDAAGNRLMVRLRAASADDPKPTVPTVAGFSTGAQPAAIPVTSGSSGAVVMAGNRIAPGSAITAGSDTAILHLPRGGQVRVCPGTTVSVTPSQSGRDLMLGMSTGAMETHYRLETSADSILTPDFRIMLAGPGEFDYAISVDRRGNTCVRSLPGNTASAIISELMGDGTYQVKSSEQVVFRAGRLREVDGSVPADCGCPEPTAPLLRASEPQGPVLADATLPTSLRLSQTGEEAKPVPPLSSGLTPHSTMPGQVSVSVTGAENAPLPVSPASEVHVQVDAPFVFRAPDPPQPAPVREAAQLTLAPSFSPSNLPPTMALPPDPSTQATTKSEHRGFFRKLGGFFAAIFR